MVNHPNRSKRDTGNPGRVPSREMIRLAREAAGLTQGQAGALLYKGERAWQQWEAGERRMDPAFWELFKAKVSDPSPNPLAGPLELCVRYLADLNGADWIKGDGPGEIDMRQRARNLQRLAFERLSSIT